MAQLNKRKAVLDDMRKRLPKTRVYGSSFGSSGSVPEYKYINYDPELIRQAYDCISNTIMEMQIALDRDVYKRQSCPKWPTSSGCFQPRSTAP